MIIWSRIQICASIISACLPTYAPLIADCSKLLSLLRSFNPRLSSSPCQGFQLATSPRNDGFEDNILGRRAWTKLKSDSPSPEVPTVNVHDLEEV